MMMLGKKNRYLKPSMLGNGQEIDDAVLTATHEKAAHLETPIRRKFFLTVWYCAVTIIAVFGARVAYLNVAKGAYYREVAEGNRIRNLPIKAPRGKIYDRFGSLLVANAPSTDAVMVPFDLPQDRPVRQREIETVAQILGLDKDLLRETIDRLETTSLEPVLLKENISQDEALLIMSQAKELSGVRIEQTAIRQYADSVIFSHLLGYEGKVEKSELEKYPEYLLTDSIGKQGIEKTYEADLRGTHGATQVEVDALGAVKKQLGIIEPIAGSDLFLTVDAELQKKVYDTLSDYIQKTGAQTGAAVAINPKNGGVLALASLPSFDNNRFARGISNAEYREFIADPLLPMFNRAIGGEYPPGSTIKPLIAAAALAEGTITEHTQVESRGGIQVGGSFFGDWKAHGFTDVRRAIAVSSDVFFYSVGGGYGNVPGLGMSRMKKYENLFGLGSKLGIDLPGEADGFIPDEAWKQETYGEKWYVGNSYHAAIGQGFVLTTPLQIANYIAAIANGGTLYQPRIVSQIRKSGGVTITNTPAVIREKFIDPDILSIVREGMRLTVTEGSAQFLKTLPVEAAGKTGTAQFGKKEDKKTHAWFVAFAPLDNPEIALVVLLDSGGESTNSVHAAKDILEWYFTPH